MDLSFSLGTGIESTILETKSPGTARLCQGWIDFSIPVAGLLRLHSCRAVSFPAKPAILPYSPVSTRPAAHYSGFDRTVCGDNYYPLATTLNRRDARIVLPNKPMHKVLLWACLGSTMLGCLCSAELIYAIVAGNVDNCRQARTDLSGFDRTTTHFVNLPCADKRNYWLVRSKIGMIAPKYHPN